MKTHKETDDRPNVVVGFLGPRLDRGEHSDRWSHWRPTVSLCQHEDFLVSKFVLIYQPKELKLAQVVAEDIHSVSPETEVCLHELSFDQPWDFEEVYGTLHDFCVSYDFDPEQANYLAHITTGTHVMQICMFLLAESRHLPGGLLQSSPPKRNNALGLDPGSYVVIDLDLSKYDLLASRFEQERVDDLSFLKAGIETRNATFNRMIEQIEYVSIRSKAPMLLMGPTGAGKTQLAQRIYELKKQKRQLTGNMVKVNCATLRGDSAMSALFGHIKGSFTGAMRDRPGLLKAADKGLLFLDEVGELGLEEQAMLLRALEAKRFMPVGSESEVSSDFQLICGTNRDLRAMVGEGEFRSDLLARIDLWTYQLPGLKDRREDIAPNMIYELAQFEQGSGQQIRFNQEARRRYLSFAEAPGASWHGNFRDLNASITRMATLCSGGRINQEVVEEEIGRLSQSWMTSSDKGYDKVLLTVVAPEHLEDIDEFDRVQLAHVIGVCRSSANLSEAGRRLYQASRTQKKTQNDGDRLRKYLAKFGLDWASITEE